MCLYSWQSRKKATKDIECYKIVVVSDGVMRSQFHNDNIWELNKVYEAEKALPGRIKYDGDVASGYFHSYNYLDSARRAFSYEKYEIICKCIIPAGTYYYAGIHSDGHTGYASKKLKITEIIYQYGQHLEA